MTRPVLIASGNAAVSWFEELTATVPTMR